MSVPFGKRFRETYFDFDPEYLPFNHGSFGATPKQVIVRRDAEQLELRRNADKYYRYTIVERQERALRKLAPYFGISASSKFANNLVFVGNATSGINIVLRSLPFKKGDVIIKANTTYGATSNTATFLQDVSDAKVDILNIPYPLAPSKIVEIYSDAIDKARAYAKQVQAELKASNPSDDSLSSREPLIVVIFDTVISQPGAKFPWKEVVKVAREKKSLSLVDAAHGLGLLTDLDLETVQPDFFVTNLHKWFFTPSPSAVLYVDAKFHHIIQTFPVSHSYVSPEDGLKLTGTDRDNLLRNKFWFVQTTDYTGHIASEAAIEFREQVCGGEEAIKEYSYKLADEAARLWSTELGTEIVLTEEEKGKPYGTWSSDDTRTAMINIYLPTPTGPYVVDPETKQKTSKIDVDFAGPTIQHNLLFNQNVYFTVFVLNDKIYARICAQVYLDIDDFKVGLEKLKIELEAFNKKYGGKTQAEAEAE